MRERHGEKGMAMPWAMMLLLLAAALSAVLLERGRGLAAATDHDDTSLRAFYAAEGGLAYARHNLALDRDYEGETIRVGPCEVDVAVTKADDGWHVVSVARPGSVRLEVSLRGADGLPAIASWAAR
jgi:type II secretory pathway component PulK